MQFECSNINLQETKYDMADPLIQEPAIPQYQGPVSMKFDKMFLNSRARAFTNTSGTIAYESLKIVLLAIFFGLNYGENIDLKPDASYWITAIVGSFMIFVAHELMSMGLKNVQELVAIGILTGHLIIHEGVLGEHSTLQAMQSDIYNAASPGDPEPPQNQRVIFEQNLSKTIMTIIRMKFNIGKLNFIGQFCNFAVVCFMIESLIAQDLPSSTYGVTIAFVVLEGLVRLKFFVFALLIAILLIAIPILCIVACFRKNPTAEAFSEELVPIEYKPSNDPNAHIQCSICFTNFEEGDKIIELPCNNKHTFHEFCIKSWFKVGATCPICRHDFSRR